MSDSRRVLSWLLLVMVVVVAGGAAALAVGAAPSEPVTGLKAAADNTTAATSYTEQLVTTGSSGRVVQHFVFEAPDRMAGYETISGKRSFIVAIGDLVYESAALPVSAPASERRYYTQTVSDPIAQVDPLSQLLRYVGVNKAVQRRGEDFTFTLPTTQGSTATLTFLVSGSYIGRATVHVDGSVTTLSVSAINGGATVVAPPRRSLEAAPPSGSSSSASGTGSAS
jgi:hypothetical protein